MSSYLKSFSTKSHKYDNRDAFLKMDWQKIIDNVNPEDIGSNVLLRGTRKLNPSQTAAIKFIISLKSELLEDPLYDIKAAKETYIRNEKGILNDEEQQVYDEVSREVAAETAQKYQDKAREQLRIQKSKADLANGMNRLNDRLEDPYPQELVKQLQASKKETDTRNRLNKLTDSGLPEEKYNADVQAWLNENNPKGGKRRRTKRRKQWSKKRQSNKRQSKKRQSKKRQSKSKTYRRKI